MERNVISINNLADLIKEKAKKQKKYVVAIDGRGGSGKSTFSKKLHSILEHSELIELDAYQIDSADIFCPENVAINFDIKFENRQFNIEHINQKILESRHHIILLEGCFSFRNLNSIKLDYTIWVEVNKEIAKERLNNREKTERTEIAPEIIELCTQKYQEAEDRYIKNFNPQNKADYIFQAP